MNDKTEGEIIRSDDLYHASSFLWSISALSGGFGCSHADLAIAGVAATSKLQTGRLYGTILSGASVVKLIAALIARAVGFWQGKLFGPVSFFAKAARFYGVELQEKYVAH